MLVIPILLLVVCIGICRWASGRYEGMWNQGSKERVPTAHTGAEMAQLFFNFEGITDVEIIEHNGVVTNYFDPSRRRLFLNREVSQGTTMAAWTVALHEAGHATQEGEALGELKWRQSVIKLTRYAPTLGAIMAVGAMILLRFPPRFAMMALLAMCLVILLLNLGTMTTELKANAGVRRFLEKHLARWPAAQEKLHGYLHRAATREVGDMLRSPRFFLFSAMPGTSSSRPVKGNEPPDQGSSS
jgi:uncharacterized protein